MTSSGIEPSTSRWATLRLVCVEIGSYCIELDRYVALTLLCCAQLGPEGRLARDVSSAHYLLMSALFVS
jgi:hypothetical protein